MARVSTSVAAKKRKKRLLKLAKGFRGERSKRFRRAKETVNRALRYSYRDRKARKRAFRSLWITRISAATRLHSMRYNDFIAALKKKQILLSRDILADIAAQEPQVFAKLVETAKN